MFGRQPETPTSSGLTSPIKVVLAVVFLVVAVALAWQINSYLSGGSSASGEMVFKCNHCDHIFSITGNQYKKAYPEIKHTRRRPPKQFLHGHLCNRPPVALKEIVKRQPLPQ